MSDPQLLVRRQSGLVLTADPSRVISRIFLPGQETSAHGLSRADVVVERVLAMPDEQVSVTLAALIPRFAERHHDLMATLTEHFGLVRHRLPAGADPSIERCQLIGAYFTQEYALEAAALFNPSMVAHPDQSGLADGELRFVMSVRAVGEGHISSNEFRTGVISADDGLRIDDPGKHLAIGRVSPITLTREMVHDGVIDRLMPDDHATAARLIGLLPPEFDAEALRAALIALTPSERDPRTPRGSITDPGTDAVIEQIRWFASCNYRLDFAADRPLSGRVIFPAGPDETHGIEDVRFTRFTRADASVTYYATYTAFDGVQITPHLMETDDFGSFVITRLVGPAAKNKGMAVFPRLVNGRYVALSRWDRESIALADSADGHRWSGGAIVQAPEQPWELIQLGNCGAPIETADGWLVLTHGVGPMREYGIGAILLDLEDPTKLVGALRRPLLTPTENERNGYVPNVVYSCGGLVHGQTLILPYGCSDSAIRFAFIDLRDLLDLLRDSVKPGRMATASGWTSG